MTASWKAHSGSVWRGKLKKVNVVHLKSSSIIPFLFQIVSWAHPEFGQVLATCSFDRTVSIWEETVSEKTTPTMAPVKRWARRSNLVDSRTSVTVCYANMYDERS